MSVIVYGEQGTGKTRAAASLAKFYKCDRVVECDQAIDALRDPLGWKAGTTLYLTNESPPLEWKRANPRRIVHITDAKRAAGLI